MAKVKAVKSASDSSLRASATSGISKVSAFRSIKKRGAIDPKKIMSEIDKKGNKNSGKKSEPISVKSERIATDKMAGGKGSSRVGGSQFSTTEKHTGPTNVPSTRFYPNKPKSIDGPKKGIAAPKSSPKAPKGSSPKRERTRTVFVAEPVVNLNEGPSFGSTTHSISKTKMPAAPKPPKGKKNA